MLMPLSSPPASLGGLREKENRGLAFASPRVFLFG
jgi:hypothetical protein